jgi:hypothetical protein
MINKRDCRIWRRILTGAGVLFAMHNRAAPPTVSDSTIPVRLLTLAAAEAATLGAG